MSNFNMTEIESRMALKQLYTKLSDECKEYYTDEESGELTFDPSFGYEMTKDGMLVEFADGVTTVDKMLDYADVELAWYVPSIASINFMTFIRRCLGEEPENSNPKAHYFFIDCVFQQISVEPYFIIRNIDYYELRDRIAILATREFSKSTLVAYMFLFMATEGKIPGFGKVNYGIYIGDSMDNNVKTTMKTIRKVYQESTFLSTKFESTVLNADFVEFIRKPNTKAEILQLQEHIDRGGSLDTAPGRMKRTFSLKGIGAKTGGKGSREALARPDFDVFDDLVPSKDDAASGPTLRSIENTIESDVMPGLNNNKNFAILIGTPYSKADPVYRRIEERSWLPVVFPRGVKVVNGKAYPMDEHTEPTEFKSVWDDRHSYRNCKRDFKKAVLARDGGNKDPMRDILQEHYLRISNPDDRMIPETLLQPYSLKHIIPNISKYNIYITTDFTTTGGAKSDLSGICVWAVNSNMDWYLLDISLKQLELEEQYLLLFQFAKKYKNLTGRNVTVGIETDGQQKVHILALKDRMLTRQEYFVIGRQKGSAFTSQGILSRLEGGNKHWRFKMTLPTFQNRKFWFPVELAGKPDYEELMEELRYVTYDSFGTKRDDGCDCVSQTLMMHVEYPATEAFREDRKEVRQNPEDKFWDKLWEQENGNNVDAFAGYV